MPISSDTMWVLVTSGLIAHADGVLDGEECELLLALIEDEADAEEYSEWLGTIGDADVLRRLLEGLPTPPAQQHRDLLESAWSMALVDGDRCEEEVKVLGELAARLGVESVQLDFWRQAWTAAEREFSGCAVDAMALVLGGDGPVFPADRPAVKQAVERLPTTDTHREELMTAATVPSLRGDDVGRRLAAMPKQRRFQILRLIAPLAAGSVKSDEASGRYLGLGEAAGIRGKAQKILANA